MKIYKSYKQFPMSKWRWPSFTPHELRSKGDGKLAIDEDAMDKLQALRVKLGRPLYVRSAYRSPYHNKKVGGAKFSMHLKAKAFDINMVNHSTDEFLAAAKSVGFTGFGFYPKSTSPFIHVDTGRPRQWGTFWSQDNRKDNHRVPEDAREVPVSDNGGTWFDVLYYIFLTLFKRS